MRGKGLTNIREWIDNRFGTGSHEYVFDEEKGVLTFCGDARWQNAVIEFADGHYVVTTDAAGMWDGTYRTQTEVINKVLIPMCGYAYRYV